VTDMCPHCGFNFAKDAPITIDGYFVTLRVCRLPDGTDADLSPTEAAVLYAIAKGGGDWVTAEGIHNRVTDCHSEKLVAVMVLRVRKKMGTLCPIFSRQGRKGGYRWVTP